MTQEIEFVGRKNELERLATEIRRGSNSLVVGMSGSGKTRLVKRLQDDAVHLNLSSQTFNTTFAP
jgi:ABC-type phosphate/phosphonate transport system ATPase subunit